ncbi:unnamed protein product [Urochloa decumbens]|uniref:Phytocyanin domain-containing protein n=1 Tax=Urochloa decumbens TaxID=240449 RepID=A0ABC9AGK7_9POAL
MAATARLLPALALAAGAFFFLLLAPAAVADGETAAAPGPLEFHVGGPRGWRVPDGNTSYDWWAMNNRFRVGDRLLFRYANDSVLVVERPAFDACDAAAPLAAFDDGATTVTLDRPGFFCFISGEPGHCQEGQKLIVRVMVHPPQLPATGPAGAPGASAQPGRGGGATSGAAVDVAAPAGVAVAAFVSLFLMMLQ